MLIHPTKQTAIGQLKALCGRVKQWRPCVEHQLRHSQLTAGTVSQLLPHPASPQRVRHSRHPGAAPAPGLFNFVIGWTFMFAPLLFTDRRRHSWAQRVSSLDLLWGLQMFLTNTFLIPYMAIRLNDDTPATPTNTPLSSLMVRGSSLVGLTGAFVCLASLLWGLFGRPDHPEFGGIHQRCHFLVTYIGSERLAYAFVWDMCFYTVFQPWLIGDNLPQPSPTLLRYLRFVPVLGLLAYLVSLHDSQD